MVSILDKSCVKVLSLKQKNSVELRRSSKSISSGRKRGWPDFCAMRIPTSPHHGVLCRDLVQPLPLYRFCRSLPHSQLEDRSRTRLGHERSPRDICLQRDEISYRSSIDDHPTSLSHSLIHRQRNRSKKYTKTPRRWSILTNQRLIYF